MLFPTFEFFTFFTVALILNWCLKRWPLIWRLFLLLFSYYFYSVWSCNFLFIIIAVSSVNFFFALAIEKTFFRLRKMMLALTVVFNLLVLAFFKYYDFFRVSTESLMERFGFTATLPLLEIILPIGLSFYIFRIISYNADVYLMKIRASRSALDFFIYVAFFPYLLSGPIIRARDFFIQLKAGGRKDIDDLYGYLTLILLGLFKKLVISSYLVLSITDDVFAVPENHSSLVVLMAVFAYSLVIYFDFSGYSDMAIGFAGLMGFKSPINFNTPYLALDIRDFWRRWHISLSSWVRDYVYIPLGGSRKGLLQKNFNLMAVMIVVGMWHGASSNFIIWGAIHGVGMVFFNICQDAKKRFFHFNRAFVKEWMRVGGIFFGWLATFIFVAFSWIFFRSPSAEDAFRIMKSMLNFDKGPEPFKAYILLLLLVGFLLVLFEKRIAAALTVSQKKMPFAALLLFMFMAMMLIFKFGPDILPSFIYFSF